jgi:hypothetical protein
MLTKDEARRIAVKVTRLPEPLGKAAGTPIATIGRGVRRGLGRLEPHTHSTGLLPHCYGAAGRTIEGQSEVRRKRTDAVRQQQTGARRRRILHRT